MTYAFVGRGPCGCWLWARWTDSQNWTTEEAEKIAEGYHVELQPAQWAREMCGPHRPGCRSAAREQQTPFAWHGQRAAVAPSGPPTDTWKCTRCGVNHVCSVFGDANRPAVVTPGNRPFCELCVSLTMREWLYKRDEVNDLKHAQTYDEARAAENRHE